MRAAVIPEYGAPNVFEIVDVPQPTCGKKDVVIKVHASSVNPIDWKIRQGTQRLFIRYQLPWILGLDVAGEVVEVGEKVTRFKVGDAVMGSVDYKRPGCYAEYTTVDASLLAHQPESIDHQGAASLPLVGLTAWQSLVSAAKLRPNEKILIQAGAGGVGSFAIQLAKHIGAEVTATCSTRNVELLKELGADHVVDYTQASVGDVVRDQDVVLDSLGGQARWDVLPCLRKGGRHVSIVSDIPPMVDKYGAVAGPVVAMSKLGWFKVVARLKHGVSSKVVLQRPNGKQLSEIARIVDEGGIVPRVDRVFDLEKIADAHTYSETKHARGKIIVSVDHSAA